MTMRIAAYLRPGNMINPTGVGKHQTYMIHELSKLPDTEVSLLVPGKDLTDGKLPESNTALNNLPLIKLPFKGRTLERLWTMTGQPVVDKWLPADTDWIYCPFEMFIPSKIAKTAATIHCDNWFVPELPWHNDPMIKKTRKRFGPIFNKICNHSDIVFTVSDFLKNSICQRFNLRKTRVKVVGNGYEEIFAPSETTDTKSDYILVTAALAPRKGAEYILNFAATLNNVMPELKIVIAAGKCSYERYIEKASKIPNIVLEEYLGPDRLPEMMRNALAVLVMSRYETFGIPVLEAMASGTPVIAANLAALPEVIGNAGIIVDPENTDEVVTAVNSLCNDTGLREKYRDLGLERVKEFSWRTCAEKAWKAMREL